MLSYLVSCFPPKEWRPCSSAPGKPSPESARPAWRLRSGGRPPPPLGTSCPGHPPLFSLLPPGRPSSSFLLPLRSLMPMASTSTGDLSGSPWAPPATGKPTARGKPTQRPHRPWSASSCEFPSRVLLIVPIRLEGEAGPPSPGDDLCPGRWGFRIGTVRWGREWKRHPVEFERQTNNRELVSVSMSHTWQGTYVPWAPRVLSAARTQSLSWSSPRRSLRRCGRPGEGPLLSTAQASHPSEPQASTSQSRQPRSRDFQSQGSNAGPSGYCVKVTSPQSDGQH